MYRVFDRIARRIRGRAGAAAGTAALVPLWLLACAQADAQPRPGRPVTAARGMVVSASAEASRAGAAILRAGGNAVDAAVAAAFALAVTYPSAGNLGGGTYLVIRMADGREAAIDAREVAPGKATRDMYVDSAGRPVRDRSLRGPLASGVPGTVDGLLTALDRFGSMPRAAVMRRAIRLARDGYRLRPHEAAFLRALRPQLEAFPSSRAVYYPPEGSYPAGHLFRQPDLAATLERIAAAGRDGFYAGRTADLIAGEMARSGGIMTRGDLAAYRCVVREPVRGSYRGFDVLSMPPSSAGGASLIEMLNVLAGYPAAVPASSAAERAHYIIETMRRVFADRTAWFGDPAFVSIPLDRLLSAAHADSLRKSIRADAATPSARIRPDIQSLREGGNTTHLSVLDRWGNAVALTTTLNSVCGSKCVAGGSGVLLNNEMDDFSARPGAPNQFGLLGSEANAIAPGKRMVSSMTPTLVLRDGTVVLVLGSPGGSTIPTTVLQILLHVIDQRMPLERAVAAPRFHHQWLPDTVFAEPGAFPAEERARLAAMGHVIADGPPIGRVDAIQYDPRRRRMTGVSDPRGHGAAVGY